MKKSLPREELCNQFFSCYCSRAVKVGESRVKWGKIVKLKLSTFATFFFCCRPGPDPQQLQGIDELNLITIKAFALDQSIIADEGKGCEKRDKFYCNF